jgi:hypothetical protein
MSRLNRTLLVVGALCAIVALAAAVPTGRQLARTQAESEIAWHQIVQIQTARMQSATLALDATSRDEIAHAPLHRAARDAVARAKAAGSDDNILHDPAAINTWKKSQGELTAALFMLVGSNNGKSQQAADALERLRVELLHEEEALAAARARYSQASAEYAASSNTVAGATVATLLRYPDLPATL